MGRKHSAGLGAAALLGALLQLWECEAEQGQSGPMAAGAGEGRSVTAVAR